MATTTIKVFRYDPSVDETPYYKTYEVPWKEYLTVLEALHYVNDNIEPIAFDFSCRGSLCGRCSLMVDGVPALSCYKVLTPDEEHVLEPLKNFPVVKDLTIDYSHMKRQMESTNLGLRNLKSLKPSDAPRISYEYYWGVLERLNMCRECGNCLAVCPVYAKDCDSFIGPAALGQIALRANDSFDSDDRVFQAVLGGVFKCIGCGKCSEVCPSYINHVTLFKQLQDKAVERDLVPPDSGTWSKLK
jgi:succinate dehydrogenase/fumarate reductase iron-sulfur protein